MANKVSTFSGNSWQIQLWVMVITFFIALGLLVGGFLVHPLLFPLAVMPFGCVCFFTCLVFTSGYINPDCTQNWDDPEPCPDK